MTTPRSVIEAFAGRESSVQGLDSRDRRGTWTMRATERVRVRAKGERFTGALEQCRPTEDSAWLLISGDFGSHDDTTTEDEVRHDLIRAFGYPDPTRGPTRTIHLLLDSRGGSLDSVYRTALYLSAYAERLVVHVPREAKSASTLLALAAHEIYLSPFSELGPLDSQIDDPRNPTNTISALDCYQSVDYVRQFGFTTMNESLVQLVEQTEGHFSLGELLDDSAHFALGAIEPILRLINPLDFGGWGRSLKIGEKYAYRLLLAHDPDEARAQRIADRLVYGYTHHPFPIDFREAREIGLAPKHMPAAVYQGAIEVVEACRRKSFVGFISGIHARTEEADETEAERRRKRTAVSDDRRPDAVPATDANTPLPHNVNARPPTAQVHRG